MSLDQFTSPGRFAYDRSSYERPTAGYVCGRIQFWNRPCAHGPDPDGRCGGVAECQPFRNGDRWECRKSGKLGGRCKEGPRHDGSCPHVHPRCEPRLSVRVLRGRLTVGAVAFTVAVIALINGWRDDDVATALITAGPLTDVHQTFTRSTGCGACHANHDASLTTRLVAVVEHDDFSASCAECHIFDGPHQTAHNFPETEVESNDMSMQVPCTACHTEHQGRDASIVESSIELCNTCHTRRFNDFSRHAAFSDGFPHDLAAASIRFDHNSHLMRHFPKSKAAVPSTCTSCHQVESASHTVPPVGFDAACAACHEDDITESPKTELLVFTLPKLEPGSIKNEKVLAACDDSYAGSGKFKKKGKKGPTTIMKAVIGVHSDDPTEYSEAVCRLVAALGEKPIKELEGRLAKLGAVEALGKVGARALLGGLTPELVVQMADAWVKTGKYKAAEKIKKHPGWYVRGGVQLRYRPVGHADPVVAAWLDLARYLEALDTVRYTPLADQLTLGKFTPGACTKCHSVTTTEKGRSIAWRFDLGPGNRSHLSFHHGPHLRLLDAENVELLDASRGCKVCHALDVEAPPLKAQSEVVDAVSQFSAISVETCQNCHNHTRVRDDCQLCHRYHRDPGFTGDLRGSVVDR